MSGGDHADVVQPPDDELAIDFDRGEVWLRGTPVRLTATEYRLLYHLASNPGRLLPAEILLAVCGATTTATRVITCGSVTPAGTVGQRS